MAKMEIEQTTNVGNTLQGVDVAELLNRVKQLEQQVADNEKEKLSVFKAGKETYEGPRAYSYWTWGGVPVLSLTTSKKDLNKDLVYKDQFGQRVNNNYLLLKLADKSEVEVESNNFFLNMGKSNKIIAESRTDNKGNLIGYAFNIEGYGEVIVDKDCIN